MFSNQNKRLFNILDISNLTPGLTGVYGIFNPTDCVYIGKSEDLRGRLLEHVQGYSKESSCILMHNPTHWFFLVLDKSQLAQIENDLIFEYSPACNETPG